MSDTPATGNPQNPPRSSIDEMPLLLREGQTAA